MAKTSRKKSNRSKRTVKVRDLASRKNPKGGTFSNVEKTRDDAAKNAINNMK